MKKRKIQVKKMISYKNIFFALIKLVISALEIFKMERCPSGRRSTPGKCVYLKRVSWVRIPLSPQEF